MKKLLTIMGLLLAVAALYSCNNKEDSLPVEQVQGRRFRAVLEQPVEEAATKAYANSDYKLFWNQGDRLSIFYDYTYNREYEFINLDGATAGEFEPVGDEPQNPTDPEITTGYDYAILPYNEQYNQCDPQGTLTVPIPAVQEYYNDPYGIGARPLMVARDKGGVLMFKHVGCYVGVRLKGDGVKVASLSIKGNNSEIIAGRLKTSFDSEGLPVSEFDPQYLSSASETVTMTLETPVVLNNDEYKVFWFNLPEITFKNGLVITVTDVDGGTGQITKSSSLTFLRTYFYNTSAKVQITSYPVSSVNVTPATLALKPGETANLTAEVLPENAIDKTVTWTSDKPEIATVDEDGKVTAVAPGEAVITAAAGGKSGSCAVKVNDVITYELKISPAECEIAVGEIIDFTYTLTRFVNGEPGDPTQVSNVTLSSDDNTIASVEDDTVEGVSVGHTTITATCIPEEGAAPVTATADVTVKNKITYRLVIDPVSAEINAGATKAFKAMLFTKTNNVENSGVEVNASSWTSSATGVATIANGTATGVAGGETTITAKYTPSGSSELTATATLKVNDVISYRLAIDPASAEINAGATKAFKAKLFTTTNNVEDSGVEVNASSWASSSTAVATIANGTATGVAGGETTITAKYTPSGSTELTATATLTVKDVISYSLAISPAENAKVAVDKTFKFTLTLTTTTNGTGVDSDVTGQATWTSSNTAFATVAAGTATGVAIGEVTITAKYTPSGSSELTATAPLTVTEDPNHAGDPIQIGEEENL